METRKNSADAPGVVGLARLRGTKLSDVADSGSDRFLSKVSRKEGDDETRNGAILGSTFESVCSEAEEQRTRSRFKNPVEIELHLLAERAVRRTISLSVMRHRSELQR